MMEHDIQEILFSQEQLDRRVSEIAEQINRDYADKEILLVSVLRGCSRFSVSLGQM